MRININKAIGRAGTTLILVLGAFLVCGAASPVKAQTVRLLPATVQVERNQALPNFPEGVTFQLKLRSGSDGPAFKTIELAFKVDGEVATTVRRYNVARPNRLNSQYSVEFNIDTRKDYLPPGARVTYYWQLQDDSQTAFETPRQEFYYHDTRYNFRELKSGLLTVRWYQGDDAFGRTALNKAQASVERLSQQYSVKPDRPIVTTIYPDTRTMFTALPPNTQEWVGGQAIPELGTIVLAAAPGDTRELSRSISHEISHQVLYQATRNPYNVPPKWLDEGLAVFNQDQIDGFLIEAYERARDNRTLYPLRALNGSFPADPQLSYLAYGQSLQIVKYILSKYGNGAIEKMLRVFKEGLSYEQVVQAGIGLTLEELDRQWKQSIGYPLPPLASPGLPPSTPLETAPVPQNVTTPTDPTIPSSPLPSPTLAIIPTPAYTTLTTAGPVAVAGMEATSLPAIATPNPVGTPSAKTAEADEDESSLLLLGMGGVIISLGLVALVGSRRGRQRSS